MAYEYLLIFHNLFRWGVVILGLLTIILNLVGWLGKKTWNKDDKLAKLFFVIIMDIQFLLGIIMYIFVSPITQLAFSNIRSAMLDKEIRFYFMEHSLLMLISLILVHIGSVKIKRADNDQSRFKYGLIFFGIAMVLIVAAMPWTRRFFPV